jgi:D-arabinose 1-dehydrogenase-like Zn-dependent alcohol dehydrogenase
MKAAVITAPGRVEFRECSLPALGADEVLVHLEGCGVCPTDLPAWRGRPGTLYPLPHGAPGHQAWGRVVRTGPEVLGLHRGERVTLLSRQGFAQYASGRASTVAILPPELDGLPVPGGAVGAVMNILRRSRVTGGDTVAVVGMGFAGVLLVELLANLGCEILALSERPWELAEAERRGAHHSIPLDDHGVARRRVMEITGGAGCNRVIEVTGEQRPLDLAGEIAAMGARLMIGGHHPQIRIVDLPLWDRRQLEVTSAYDGDDRERLQGVHEGIAALLEGRLDPFPLFTRIPMKQLSHAFRLEEIRPPGFFKGLLIP